eukprot:TRINITY_DN10045_c0_g1_i1.p1 TRINITY_DN10045_c0_g1~~TRINITY_DN10045_c0_g1_i1.p1  ORF type:complete len:89 (-),score=6.77 TRINITY_DN10045_c0_g1_i1:74-340(-)
MRFKFVAIYSFPIMSPQELAEIVAPSKVVPSEVLVEAYVHQSRWPYSARNNDRRFQPRGLGAHGRRYRGFLIVKKKMKWKFPPLYNSI